MTQHPEIIAAPYSIWIAPVGTAFPSVNAEPDSAWQLLGTNGTRNYEGQGVTVIHRRDWTSPPPAAGQTAVSAAMLENEELRFKVALLDLTLEQYALVLGSNAIAATPRRPAEPGTRAIGLSVGARNLPEFALLARGPSAYVEGLIAQYEVPRCHEAGSPQIVFRRGQPSDLAIEFRALPDPAATSASTRFGRLVAQDSTAVAAMLHDDGRYLLTSSGLFLEI